MEKIDSMTTESPGAIFFQQEEDQKETIPKEVYLIASDDLNEVCPVCRESFDKIYDDKSDEWRFLNAIIDESNDLATHLTCFQNLSQLEDEPPKKKIKFE
jgi:hypothetical protein